MDLEDSTLTRSAASNRLWHSLYPIGVTNRQIERAKSEFFANATSLWILRVCEMNLSLRRIARAGRARRPLCHVQMDQEHGQMHATFYSDELLLIEGCRKDDVGASENPPGPECRGRNLTAGIVAALILAGSSSSAGNPGSKAFGDTIVRPMKRFQCCIQQRLKGMSGSSPNESSQPDQ